MTIASPWTKSDYLRLFIAFLPVAILTWGIHEFAHYLAGRALGYDMWISFNQVGLVDGGYDSTLDQNLVSMAGPVVTWLQAVLAWLFIRKSKALWAYSLVFLALWTRALAMLISFISNPNDEARVSLALGLPIWLLPAVSVAFVFTLAFSASRTLQAGWKGNLVAYVAASLVTAIVVLSDRLLFAR